EGRAVGRLDVLGREHRGGLGGRHLDARGAEAGAEEPGEGAGDGSAARPRTARGARWKEGTLVHAAHIIPSEGLALLSTASASWWPARTPPQTSPQTTPPAPLPAGGRQAGRSPTCGELYSEAAGAGDAPREERRAHGPDARGRLGGRGRGRCVLPDGLGLAA